MNIILVPYRLIHHLQKNIVLVTERLRYYLQKNIILVMKRLIYYFTEKYNSDNLTIKIIFYRRILFC